MNKILSLVIVLTVFLNIYQSVIAQSKYSDSFVQSVAGKLINEGGNLESMTCTVKNRLVAGWSQSKVMSAYYAPYSIPSKEEKRIVRNVLESDMDCENLYFAYSQNDIENMNEFVIPVLIEDGVYYYTRMQYSELIQKGKGVK